MCEQDLAFYKLQGLIYHKTQLINEETNQLYKSFK